MILKTQIISESIKNVTVYGIVVTTDNETIHFNGLTERQNEIEALQTRINNSDMTKEHLNDVIKDFIIGNAYERLILNNL